LPSPQELLAQFRCDEIWTVVLAEFKEKVKLQRWAIDAGRTVQGLGGLMKKWTLEALSASSITLLCDIVDSVPARYDEDASRYHQDVYQRKRADLVATMESLLSPLSAGQFKLLHRDCLHAFEQELLAGMSQDDCQFADLMDKLCTRLEKKFEENAREASIEGAGWNWEDELELLKTDIRNEADKIRASETKRVSDVVVIVKTCSNSGETRYARWFWRILRRKRTACKGRLMLFKR
jgi:protein SEY1